MELSHLRSSGCGSSLSEINENHGQTIVVKAPSARSYHHLPSCSHHSSSSIDYLPSGGSSCGCEETVIKGRPEIVMHRQPTLIVKRPPTTVRINHAPMVVKSAPIVFHRGGDTIHRPVIRHQLQRKVIVKPVTVKLVKPITKKVLIEKRPCGCASAPSCGCASSSSQWSSQSPASWSSHNSHNENWGHNLGGHHSQWNAASLESAKQYLSSSSVGHHAEEEELAPAAPCASEAEEESHSHHHASAPCADGEDDE